VATWDDVCDLAERLPGATLGPAGEGSPVWYAGRHTLARLRWDEDDHALAQVWSGDMDLEQALSRRRELFPLIRTFEYRVTMWCRLDLVERRRACRAHPRLL
jgi:hypothetical protein